MVNIIDMQNMRYVNLFEKITGIRTRFCFEYNNFLIICVPQPMISKAIGELGIEVVFSGETAWGGCAIAIQEAEALNVDLIEQKKIKQVLIEENKIAKAKLTKEKIHEQGT